MDGFDFASPAPYGGDLHVLYLQAATRILLRRYVEAMETLDAMHRTAAALADLDPDPTQWFLDLVAQARGPQQRIAADPAGPCAAPPSSRTNAPYR